MREAGMAHPNEELARRSLEAFSTGDMEAFAGLLDEDAVFHFPGRGPLAGDHQGKGQVLATLAKQGELSGGTFRVELHDVLANDEHAVLLIRARAERGGETWNDNAVLVFHTKNGKVSEAWLHPGDQYAGDEFFS
jgi:ketosteroid isomerase-like protein